MRSLLIVASFPFICFALGILFVGGSIHYLDCNRNAGQVNCVITTKFLGTFNTEKRDAIGVTSALLGKDCDQDGCLYRVELSTSTGTVPVSIDYSPESKATTITQINAFLADTSRQTIRMQVVFWRMLIWSVVSIVFGAIGLLWCIRQLRNLRKGRIEWSQVILPGEGKAHEHPELLPMPDNLRVERDISGLRFSYRHPSWRGLVGIVVGMVFLGSGWMLSQQASSNIVTVTLIFSGVIMIYLGLVGLINRVTIQVTYSELQVRHVPLPIQCDRRLQGRVLWSAVWEVGWQACYCSGLPMPWRGYSMPHWN
jgi:hypothetical protein